MKLLVRVVVLNYNGGELTSRCLEQPRRARLAARSPRDRRRRQRLGGRQRRRGAGALPRRARLIEAGANLGFAGGTTSACATSPASTTSPCSTTTPTSSPAGSRRSSPRSRRPGARARPARRSSSRRRFVELTIASPTFVPGRGDPRELGVRVSGVRVDGVTRWRDAQFGDGFYGEERGAGEELRLSAGPGPLATLRVPVGPAGERCRLRWQPSVRRRSSALGRSEVHPAIESAPGWVDVPLDAVRVDVIQNAGSLLVRGRLRRRPRLPRGRPRPVRRARRRVRLVRLLGAPAAGAISRDVGLLDERLFLYYEDTDLSWRGRAQGWRYRYVPEADRPPRPHGDQRRGLGPLPALRRAQPAAGAT